MAQNHFLTVYRVKIKDKKQQYIEGNLFEYLKEALCECSNINTLEDQQKTFEIYELKKFKDRNVLFGLANCGNYGEEGELINVKKKGKRTPRTRDDSDSRRFYFEIYAPSGYGNAILLLESVGTRGIKSVFTRILNNSLEGKKEGYSAEIKPQHSSKKFRETLDAAKSITLTYRKQGFPDDPVDSIKHENSRLKRQTAMTMSGYDAVRLLDFFKKNDILKMTAEGDDLFEITGIPQVYDEDWSDFLITVEGYRVDGKPQRETFQFNAINFALCKTLIEPSLYINSDDEYYKKLPGVAHAYCLEMAPKLGFMGKIPFPSLESDLEDCLQ